MYAKRNKADLKATLLRPGIIRLAIAQRGFGARHCSAHALASWSGAPANYQSVRRSGGLRVVTVGRHDQERLVFLIWWLIVAGWTVF